MSVEIKKLPVSSIVPVQPPGPAGSYYYNIVLPSTTADGYVYYQNANWATCRAAATGNSSSSTSNPGIGVGIQASHQSGTSPYYIIFRTFLYFDMSALPVGTTVLSGTLRIHTYDDTSNSPAINYADSAVVAQEGTQAGSLSTADYDAFTGPAFGNVAWKPYNVNYIELNQDGIDYLNSQVGGEGKICLREYTYDYSNPSPPPDANQFNNGVYYREAETYDFYNPNGVYHREYVPFLNLYYKVDWEDTNPGQTTVTNKYLYALDGPVGGVPYNHDLRIAHMYAQQTTWSGARNATAASSNITGDTGYMYAEARSVIGTTSYHRVWRSYIAFDLSEITDDHGDVTAVYLRLVSRGYSGVPTPKVQVFQGTWDYTLTTGDFDSFTGSAFSAAQFWQAAENQLSITINQDGIDYVDQNKGNIVYFCIREYDHDVLDVSPGPGEQFNGSFYGTGQGADATYDPRLHVIYAKSQ